VSTLKQKCSPIIVLYLSAGDEHLASGASATHVEKTLTEIGYLTELHGVSLPITPQQLPVFSKLLQHQHIGEAVPIVFNCMHGKYGEDGCLQGLLDMFGIHYTGSSLTASAKCFHKDQCKDTLSYHEVPTPRYLVISSANQDQPAASWETTLDDAGFQCPVIVKPAASGSSLGIRIAHQPAELPSAIKSAATYSDRVLIEEFVSGREVSVGILDGRVLGAMEIQHGRDIFNPHGTNSAYPSSRSTTYVPLSLQSLEILERILDDATRCYTALQCRGACRVDLIVSEANQPYILEIDSVPGLGPDSLLPKLAAQNGISFDALLEAMIASATKTA